MLVTESNLLLNAKVITFLVSVDGHRPSIVSEDTYNDITYANCEGDFSKMGKL